MELLLGAVAGALAQIFTIPVSVIATRQQVGKSKAQDKHSAPSSPSEVGPSKPSYSEVADPRKETAAIVEAVEDDSFLGVGRQIIREEGITGLWLGLKPSLVLTVNPAITYGAFERVKSLVLIAKEKSGGGTKLTPWQAFFIGSLSKSLATVVSLLLIYGSLSILTCVSNQGNISVYNGESPDTSGYCRRCFTFSGIQFGKAQTGGCGYTSC